MLHLVEKRSNLLKRVVGRLDVVACLRIGAQIGIGDDKKSVATRTKRAGLMAQLAAEHDLLVTIEEGVLAGGFGSAVWETLNEAGAAPRILRVGLPDRYVTHGKPALLHEEVGFTGRRIAERVAVAIAGGKGAEAFRGSAAEVAGSAIVGA